jgi:branched-subunit amino acid ABC-type transport system permease component
VIEEALGQIPISLLASSLYATAAVGLTLNYLVLRYADFALGEYITVGCYVAALLTLSGLDPITAMTASGLSGATLAFLADELAVKPLERRGATALQVFIATIGVSLLIRYVLSIVADLEDLLFLSSGFRVVPLIYIGNRPLTNLHLLAVSVLVVSVAALTYVSLRTKLGKGMRAVASNRDLAISSGIPVQNDQCRDSPECEECPREPHHQGEEEDEEVDGYQSVGHHRPPLELRHRRQNPYANATS